MTEAAGFVGWPRAPIWPGPVQPIIAKRRELLMLAVGCLIPIVLIAAGGFAGGALGGYHAAIVGAMAGGAIGMAAMMALVWAFGRIRSRSFGP
jgi:hypothetical protein